MQNWLFAETLILDRLKADTNLAPLLRAIESMTDFESLIERSQILPAVFVGFAGERIIETYQEARAQLVQQRWSVTVATSSAAKILSGAKVREQADAIMTWVGQSLFDFRLIDGETQGLVPIDAPAPIYRTGKAYFFLLFGLNFVRDYGSVISGQ